MLRRAAQLALGAALVAFSFAACNVPEFSGFDQAPQTGGDACSGDDCGGQCGPGRADCDGDADNGCEADTTSDQKHCGQCNRDCAPEFCSGGQCSGIDCPPGFADCDRTAANGCEADLARDPDCGRCNAPCTNAHGSTSCEASKCVPVCAFGFDDCDGDPANGCETDLGSSLSHCGACGDVCNLAHATESCDAGVCQIGDCDANFDDCDGDQANGCEADLTAPATCGTCSNACSTNGGIASCSAGSCGMQCLPGRDDCNRSLLDGCEVDTDISVQHCGDCGTACPAGSGTAVCASGICGVSSCTAPFADCNNDNGTPGGNGCETNTNNDPMSCGGCGVECYYPNGVGKCVAGSCVLDRCSAGWADCALAPGCETKLGTTTNCASCGDACTNDHGSPACIGTACVPTCQLGFGDCNGDPGDGCETPLDTPSHCGSCNTTCNLDHASESCSTGKCQITSCDSGWGNCDNEPLLKTGCETSTRTLSDCGSCGLACNLPNATESCTTGTCQLVSCDSGYDDCSAGPGCETSLMTTSNCGACNNVCNLPHAATHQCIGQTCRVGTCSTGWDNCDASQTNGCEHDTSSDPANCGTCNNVCGGTTRFCVNRSCANHLQIQLVNSATSAEGGQPGLNFNHVLQNGSGNYRLIVVLVTADGNGQSTAKPSVARYAGSDLTLSKEIWSGNRVWAGIYTIKDASLPAAPGTYPVLVTGSEFAVLANVYEFKNVEQPAPIDASGGSSGNNCCCDDPSDSINVGDTDAWIVSAAAMFGTGTGTPLSGQTVTYTTTYGALGFKAGYLGPVAAGSRTISWDMNNCNSSAHALISISPVSTP